MKSMQLSRLLAACAGAAISTTAMAQYQMVSNLPGTFTDISTTGISVGAVSDDSEHTFFSNIGNAAFPAGNILVGSNGVAVSGLTTGSIGYSNNDIAHAAATVPSGIPAGGMGAIAAFWDDLYPILGQESTTIYYQEVGDTLIIQWNNQGHISQTAGQTALFQIKVFGTGDTLAQIIYPDVTFGGTQAQYDNAASATIGYVSGGNPSGLNVKYSYNTASIADGAVLSLVLNNTPGACCLDDGTCSFGTEADCVAAGGVFQMGVTCANANCPAATGCCFLDGTCMMVVPDFCASQGAVSTAGSCGAGACTTYQIVSDRPGAYVDILTTGAYYDLADDGFTDITSGVGNALLPAGTHRLSNNGAISWGNLAGASFSNQALPDDGLAGGGMGLAVHWDDLYTYDTNIPGQGVYVQEMNGNLYITWNVGHISETDSQGVVQLQVFGSGPVLAQYVYQNVQFGGTVSDAASATVGIQRGMGDSLQHSYNTAGAVTSGTILSIVAAGAPTTCYANCDNSTTAPALNVADFTCFLQQFAAGNATANCDNSTTVPTLNVADFTCFLQSFAAGCP